MVKRCCYGTCKSDTRYPDRLTGDVKFIPFPKPLKSEEKCHLWIRLCGRPHEQLNMSMLRDRPKAKHLHVCTKHFVDGNPTDLHPNPEPASSYEIMTLVRRPPKRRWLSDSNPKQKKAKTVLNDSSRNEDNIIFVDPSMKENCNPRCSSQDTVESSCSETTMNDNLALEMLALAAESESTKRQLAGLILKNVELTRKIADTEQLLKRQVTRTFSTVMSATKLRQNTKKDGFIYYTGLSEEQLSVFYRFLVPVERPFTMSRKVSSAESMSMEDQLLLVMMKLRQNFDFTHLGELFYMSQQDTSTLFRNWVQYMFYRCSSVSIWPHRDVIIDRMPKAFKEAFPTTMVIIDGTQLKIERPSSLTRHSQCYSDYKSCNTLKGLVGIDPRGSVIFASMLFSGSISDKQITKDSGFFELLKQLKECGKIQEGDDVMVDKGFHISEEIKELGLKLNIPAFGQKGVHFNF